MSKTKAHRDETAILAEIEAAQAEHHEGAETLPAPALRSIAERIRAGRAELSAAIAAGADPCPGCGSPPFGMVKTPARLNAGVMLPALYEIGCLGCPTAPDGTRPSARGYGRASAVEAWNKGERVKATA